MRRAIKLQGLSKQLELSKCTEITLEQNPQYEFIHIDRLRDGTWRLVYTKETIDDISKLSALEIIRED
jgi:hypothetical protein